MNNMKDVMENLYKLLGPEFINKDSRGSLTQLVHNGYQQVNVLLSKAGVARGGHYHKKNHEAFYIVDGECEAVLIKGDQRETVVFSSGMFFSIEPYTIHAFRFLRDTTMIGMYDLGVENEDGTKDIFTPDT